jgi:hypothetical protein
MIDLGEVLEVRGDMLQEINNYTSGSLCIDHELGLTHVGRMWDIHITLGHMYWDRD